MYRNIILDPLPTIWETEDQVQYHINSDFRIGIQINQVMQDDTLLPYEKNNLIIGLLFGDEKEKVASFPQGEEYQKCLVWFLMDWNKDKKVKNGTTKRVLDYDIDQYRIYADFMHIYGINLNSADMHWFEFMALLWNMPVDESSFLKVIGYRQAKTSSDMDKVSKADIEEKHRIYDLDQPEEKKYSEEQKKKIDNFDTWMAEAKKKAAQKQQIIDDFNRR